jgi:hypothetical protein
MPIRPNGVMADLLQKEITASFGKRWFTRSDCVELLESLYQDGVTGYMYSTFITKGYVIVRTLIDRGSIVSLNRVELCLAGNEDYWADQPTVLFQYGDRIEQIIDSQRLRVPFSMAGVVNELGRAGSDQPRQGGRRAQGAVSASAQSHRRHRE